MRLVHDVTRIWALPDPDLAELADRLIAQGLTHSTLYREVALRIALEMIPKSAPAIRAEFGRRRRPSGGHTRRAPTPPEE